MTIEEMKKRKKELGFSNAKLSEVSGVPVGTVQKILSGKTTSPRYDTVCALERALAEESHVKQKSSTFEYSRASLAREAYVNVLRDSGAAYHERYENEHTERPEWHPRRSGDKTLKDYSALPGDVRVEMIDGFFFDMSAPTTIHQMIGAEICYSLKEYVRKNKGECIPLMAPTDVQLDCDDKTMVQPDVLVLCDKEKLTRERIIGAPDFVVEIASPGNTFKDVVIKTLKYRKAGVKEYWIVFPEEMCVSVYDFTKSDIPEVYEFDSKIPVGIWDGDCEIDFKYIYSRIAFMYSDTH